MLTEGVEIENQLRLMRSYFDSGVTRSSAFRKRQLGLLRDAVIKYEEEIYAALYADLKKSREEVYATETGLLVAELNVALKNIESWMRPRRASTNLVNQLSTCRIFQDPLGVVFIIAPWNYPFQLTLVPLIGAIAGGNCALVKPSEWAPATSALIQKIIQEIFAPEYVMFVQGDGANLVPGLMRAFRFDHVFYTGSVEVGRSIYQLAAAKLVPVTLELGGKSPVVVEADANLSVAARRIVVAKYVNAGQTCVAPDYVLVHESVSKTFLDELKKVIVEFYGHDAALSDSYGKIIHGRRFDKLVSYLSQGELVSGGRFDHSRLYIEPTVLTNVSLESALMKDEIFGPILPVLKFNSKEEALNIIRQNPDPLSFYLFTNNKWDEKWWFERVSFGGGCVNNAAWQFANHFLPFGGIGNSGIGRYHGRYSFEAFTHAKPVMKSAVWFDLKIKYPPFTGRLNLFKRIFR